MDEMNEMEPNIKFTCPLCDEEFLPGEEYVLREHMKDAHLQQMLAYQRRTPHPVRPKKVTLCYALGCDETSENTDLTFFCLPRRPRSLVWLINAGRYDMLSTPVERYMHHKICSKHFEMSACADTLKSRVTTKAVPTIFSHSLEIMSDDLPEDDEEPAKSTQPRCSNSLIDQFHDTIIFERGSQTKKFSISIVSIDQISKKQARSRPNTKAFVAGDKILIYTLLQGQDVYKMSEYKFRKSLSNTSCRIIPKGKNASTNKKVSKANEKVPEFVEANNTKENYHIFSLGDIDPLLHQNNDSSMQDITEEIGSNSNETELLVTTNDDTFMYDQTSMPSEDVDVQKSLLEHNYCTGPLFSMSSLCRLCAKELWNPDEKSVFDILQSLHPLFQKCLDLSEAFKENDCLPDKMCSSCVEKLHMCDTLFQQIAETNAKLKTYLSRLQDDAGSNNTNKIDEFEVDEQQKEDQQTLFRVEVTNENVTLDEPSEESCECYMCDECPNSRVYKTLMDLRCHKALVHETDKNSGNNRKSSYRCKYCRLKFHFLKQFYYHMCKKKMKANRQEHPPVQRILKTVYTRRYKRHADGFICCTCGLIASNENDIKAHWKSHLPSLPPMVKRPFRKRERIYKCHLCRRSFTSERYLNNHIEMHANWRCKTCGKLFKSPFLLYAHKRKHEADVTRLCHLCGKMYSDLQGHLRNIHNTSEKRTFICHICGKVFCSKASLNRHIINLHECVNSSYSQKTSDEYAPRVEANPKTFKCELCSMTYEKQESLRSHTEKQHPACKVCQIRFLTKDSKDEHDISEHNQGSSCEQVFFSEHSIQVGKEIEETAYPSEDFQVLSGNVVLLPNGNEYYL